MVARRIQVLLWWAGAAVVYPVLLIAAVATFAVPAGQIESPPGDPAMSIIILTTAILYFGLANFVALSKGAPRRLWLVPFVVFAVYAGTSLVTYRPPDRMQSIQAWYVNLLVSVLMLAAVTGTGLGAVVFDWRVRGRRALTEEALEPVASSAVR